jgi:predicted esterase
MRNRLFSVLLVSVGPLAGALLLGIAGCSSDSAGNLGTEAPLAAPTIAQSPQPAPAPTTHPGIAGPPVDDPGPAPAGCGTIKKDSDGFFTRTTAKSSYVGFVPKSYTGQPTTLVVGMHGCGDDSMNFATWAVNPFDTRAKQTHIGISIGGQEGNCWDTNKDADKVMAAIEDVSKCFYVHKQKVVLAGFSSGGMLAYKMGLGQAEKFAGIIIESSGLGGAQPSAASWKINVAHIAHKSDDAFPLSKVQADWAKLEAAGIPLQKSTVDGPHDGTSEDWINFLLPKIDGWKAPPSAQ